MEYELKVLNRKLVMDSREIAELTYKRHSDVLRDIRNMYEKLALPDIKTELKTTNAKPRSLNNKIPNALTYKDAKGELRPYYLLTYEDTLLLLTGYSVKLRQAVIKRWIYLENSFRKERQKAIEVRNTFTDELKDRGYSKPHEYIQTTNQMKDKLSIENKKDSMSERELKAIRTSEALASLMFDDEYGYSEVNPVCVQAADIISSAINSNKRLTAN